MLRLRMVEAIRLRLLPTPGVLGTAAAMVEEEGATPPLTRAPLTAAVGVGIHL
jgi:hypothetical protein